MTTFRNTFCWGCQKVCKQSHKSFNPQVFYHLGSFLEKCTCQPTFFLKYFLLCFFGITIIVKVIHIRPIRWKSLAFVWVSQAFWRIFSVQGCTALAWARRKRFGGPYWPARLGFGLSWVKAGRARLAHLFR